MRFGLRALRSPGARLPLALGLSVLWALVVGLLLPWLVSETYAGRGTAFLQRLFAEKRAQMPLGYYLLRLRLVAAGGAAGIFAAVYAYFAVLRDIDRGGPLTRRFLPLADAASLAGIRIGVCSIALICLLLEDPASSALFPRFMKPAVHVQMMVVLRQFSVADAVLASAAALSLLKYATVVSLAFAIAGLYTRVALLLSFCGLLAIGGVLRMYTHFFHSGLLPLHLIAVLMLMPCADAWSLDRLRRRRRGLAEGTGEALAYTWGRFTCWTVVAITYVAAGTSKLRHGGLFWWDGLNLKHKVLSDALNIGTIDLPFASFFASLPTSYFAPLGLGTLVVELGFLFVPFSRRARLLVPLGAVGIHVGILVAQEILFLDLLLIQLIFYNHRPWAQRLAGSVIAAPAPQDDEPRRAASPKVAMLALVPVLYAAAVALGVEAYPLTTWAMYSDRTTTSVVEYTLFRGIDTSGRKVPIQLEDVFGVLIFSRTYDIIPRAFDPTTEAEVHEILATYAEIKNRDAPPSERLASIEFDLRSWDFVREASDPDRGRRIKQFVHVVKPRAGGHNNAASP